MAKLVFGRGCCPALPYFLLFILFSSADCPSAPKSSQARQVVPQAGGEHGYALLFNLMGDEANVSKLRWIKRERPELKQLVKEISKTCGEAHQRLEAFGKADPTLNLKNTGLPPAEVETRSSISKAKGKALLAESGKEFELQLLLTQNEALTYGEHLAKTAAKMEANAARVEFLTSLATELSRHQQKVIAVLLANYTLQASK